MGLESPLGVCTAMQTRGAGRTGPHAVEAARVNPLPQAASREAFSTQTEDWSVPMVLGRQGMVPQLLRSLSWNPGAQAGGEVTGAGRDPEDGDQTA